MTATLAVLSLAGMLASMNISGSPTWEKDYSLARKHAEVALKPLAVFVSAGEAGWRKLTPDGDLSVSVRRTLSQNYVCVYVNTETDKGQQAAAKLGLTGRAGVVISDRTTDLKAFQHAGQLSQDELSRRLARYADPKHVVTTTESLAPPPPAVAPTSYFGDCPNCRRHYQ